MMNPLITTQPSIVEISFPEPSRALENIITIDTPISWLEKCFVCGEGYERIIDQMACCCGRCCKSCISVQL